MTRVLLIDDSETVRGLLKEMVTHLGYQVELASDGASGLEAVSRFEPDVVVSDLHMPRLGGKEVVRALRASRPTLPVIIFTDYAEISLAVDAMKEGAHGYLIKGSPIELLAQEIESALEYRRLQERNRKLEEERARLQEQKIRAERRAALGRVVAGVAHEISNPLAALIANLTWMEKTFGPSLEALRRLVGTEDEPEPSAELSGELRALSQQGLRACLDELPQVLDASHRSGQRIVRIISDLRRLERPEHQLGACELYAAVEQAVKTCRSEVHRPVEIRWTRDAGRQPIALSEDDAVLVLSSVLVNAAQALRSEQGYVAIDVARDHRPGVVVRIRDTGCGISPEDLGNVGQPFFTTKSPRGRGLSLCLVQQILRSAGGEFDLESKLDVGTTVTLRLPTEAVAR